MSNDITTPYMTLILPIAGLELGPQYAILNNTAFTTIDQHTHIPGQGLPIPTAGFNIDADLPVNSFNLLNIRSTRFANQSVPLSLPADLNGLYVVNGDLFFNDGIGNQIQITLAGSVDTSGSGNITGMGATTASVVYTAIDKTFSFFSNTNTPAFVKTGPLSIGRNVVSPFTVTLQPQASQTADYTITFPAVLPPAQALVTERPDGQMQFVEPDNNTITFTGGFLTANLPPGMIMPYAGSAVPSGWLFCNGQDVSRTTYSALFAIIGTTWGPGNGSTTFNVPNGQGVFLRGVSNGNGLDPDAGSRSSYYAGGNSGDNVGSFQPSTFESHNHTQNSHNHTQDAHNHTQDVHNHTQVAHSHNFGVRTSGPQGGTSVVQAGVATTSDVNVTTSSTTAINVSTIATNQATTATNQATTATNQATGGSETRSINIYVNYLIKI